MLTHGICWIENRIIPLNEARISVMDHGLLYGDGIFEGIRFYNNNAFLVDAHLKRLESSAKALALKLPKNISELKSIIVLLPYTRTRINGLLRLGFKKDRELKIGNEQFIRYRLKIPVKK